LLPAESVRLSRRFRRRITAVFQNQVICLPTYNNSA
jgi:hypothetical protein